MPKRVIPKRPPPASDRSSLSPTSPTAKTKFCANNASPARPALSLALLSAPDRQVKLGHPPARNAQYTSPTAATDNCHWAVASLRSYPTTTRSPESHPHRMSLPPGTDANSEGISQATFDAVTRNLLDIGCTSVQEYLYGNTKTGPVTTFCAAELAPSPPSVLDTPPSTSAAKPTETVNVNAVSQLHQACQRAFGSTDTLKFEFIEEKGPRSKQCILTIIRPDGTERSYTTQPIFARKNEAKAEAAKVAIEMGALDFLMHGEGNASKINRGLVLTSIPETPPEGAATLGIPTEVPDRRPSSVDEIESCCIQWRAGRVAPHWVAFFESKLGHKHGCALRIELSPHVVRVYLSEPTFDKYGEAKLACAQVAVSEGVLDFIKHGNGQTRPSSPQPFMSTLTHRTGNVVNTRTPLTLQSFYDSLPRPFPERLDMDDAHEINAPGWLNTMFQNARGGKLAISFFFTSDNTPGLHGCLLKLDRPGDYRAYLVDARFPKRSDAKAAVCLQAMSLGVGDYIREITSGIGAQVTSIMRSFSTNLIYPTITTELSKVDVGLHPRFDFEKDRDAFGATLVIELSTSATAEQVRRYTVPCNYRNKADAKAAVVCQAAEHGVIEFIRFRNQVPLGYVSPYTLRSYNPDALAKRKLEDGEASEGKASKKRKKSKKGEGDLPMHGEGSHTAYSQNNGIHQIHGVPEPGGIGPSISIGDHSSDQSRPGFGNEGGSGAAYYAAQSQYGWPSTSLTHAMHVPHHGPLVHVTRYSVPPHPRFGHGSGSISARYEGHGVYQMPLVYPASNFQPSPSLPYYSSSSGPSGIMYNASSYSVAMHTGDADPEPGEVRSSRAPSSKSSDHPVGQPKLQGAQGSEQSSDDKEGKGRATKLEGIASDGHRSDVHKLVDYCVRHGLEAPSIHEEQSNHTFKVWVIIGKERFELPTTFRSAEEGRQRVSKQVLARLRSQKSAANEKD